MVAYTYHSSTMETEAGGSSRLAVITQSGPIVKSKENQKPIVSSNGFLFKGPCSFILLIIGGT